MAVSRQEAIQQLAISERQFDRWRKEPGFPETSGGFDLPAIKAWLEDRERKGSQLTNQVATINAAIKAQKLKEIQNKVILQQMEIDEKNRTLVPTTVVHELLMECAGMIRGLGVQLQRGGNPQVAKMIEDQMDKMKRLINDRLRNSTRNSGQ